MYMYTALITALLFVFLPIQGAFAALFINNPNMRTCGITKISWEPTTPPYTIEVVSASDPCGDALDTMDDLTSTVLHYTVNLSPGTQVALFISDAAGNEAWSSNITVGANSNNTCNPGSTPSSTPSNSSSNIPVASPAETTPSSSVSPSSTAIAGAINQETNPNGALSFPQACTPLLSITALVVMFTLIL